MKNYKDVKLDVVSLTDVSALLEESKVIHGQPLDLIE
jgi:hypothetical protein